MKWTIAIFALWVSTAQAGPAEDAAQAADDVRRASELLANVENRRDRVQALTTTINALENGMAALREGLRRAAIRRTTLERSLAARNDDITRLLGTLQLISRAPEPSYLLHPLGPTGTARSGMILADLTPTLQAEVATLNTQITELKTLEALQLSAQDILQQGLDDLQSARMDLSQAISDRTPLPRRFTADPKRTAILTATADTLDAFAAGLSFIAVDEILQDLPQADALQGTFTPPVLGN
ncbi:MAG: peptidase M23, partial [Pseudomonadota bacterium]